MGFYTHQVLLPASGIADGGNPDYDSQHARFYASSYYGAALHNDYWDIYANSDSGNSNAHLMIECNGTPVCELREGYDGAAYVTAPRWVSQIAAGKLLTASAHRWDTANALGAGDKLADWAVQGTSKAYILGDGGIYSNAGIALRSNAITLGAVLTLHSLNAYWQYKNAATTYGQGMYDAVLPDGATANLLILDTAYTISTAGSALLRVRTAGVDRGIIDYSGFLAPALAVADGISPNQDGGAFRSAASVYYSGAPHTHTWMGYADADSVNSRADLVWSYDGTPKVAFRDTQVEFLTDILVGPTEYEADAGMVPVAEMAVSATPLAGTPMGYRWSIDTDPILEVYSEADHAGSIKNQCVKMIRPPALVSNTVIRQLATGDAITPDRARIRVQGTSGAGAIALTSTPSITAGHYDGHTIVLQGAHASDTLEIQDETTVAGANVYLDGSTDCVLALGATLTLVWDAYEGKWFELGRSMN